MDLQEFHKLLLETRDRQDRANKKQTEAIQALIRESKQQQEELRKKLSSVFEALDKRLVLIENGLVVAAGDSSQARTNTHEIRNVLQGILAAQMAIKDHLGISDDEPLPPSSHVSATPR